MKWIFLLLPLWLNAQQRAPLDGNFRFNDGVYLTHAALLNNRPDVDWSDIDGEMVQLTEDHRVQVEGFGYKSGAYDQPYAISLDGLPYLFVREEPSRGFHEFAGLRIRGTYSTMQYDTVVRTRHLMKAYNPVNGIAFREGYVERDRQNALRRIVDMRSGRRLPLDQATVMRLVDGEDDLLSALERTAHNEENKVLRALVIFNERHPLLLPLPQANR